MDSVMVGHKIRRKCKFAHSCHAAMFPLDGEEISLLTVDWRSCETELLFLLECASSAHHMSSGRLGIR